MAAQQGLAFDFVSDSDECALAEARLEQWTPETWVVAEGWAPVVRQFLAGGEAARLGGFMRLRLQAGAQVYPPHPLRALALTALPAVRVVILGQDPYHGPGQAEGLAFSVASGVRVPPSLRNIFKEVAREGMGREAAAVVPRDGSLVRWARQGVLLLNSALTVEAGRPASHAAKGWEALTDALIQAVAQRAVPTVFMLWGAQAQAKAGLLQEALAAASPTGEGALHLVLMANHPSPLSALRPPQPFMGCGHFGRANDFLVRHGQSPVAW